MLVKKELLSIPPLPMPKVSRKENAKYIPAAQIVDLQKSGRILAVDYFTGGKLYSRFFCDGKNYAVYKAENGVWRNSYPYPGCSGYYGSSIARVDEVDAVVNSFFPDASWKRGVELVNTFVYQKNAEKRERERDNLYALMRRHMDMYPSYPENIREYCSQNVFQKRFIFFSAKDKKGIRTAQCSHCGAKFSIDTPAVSGKETTCPACHTKAVYRGTWIKSDLSEEQDICINHKVNNQLLIRWAHVERTYTWPEFEPQFRIYDFAYSLYTAEKGQQRIYTYKYFHAPFSYAEDWHRLPNGSTCDSCSYIYTDNLDEVFGERIYNVNLKAGLAGKKLKLQFVHLLDNLKNSRKAEYLFKLGLPMLAASAWNLKGDPEGQGTFQKQVGVSKQYLPMLRDMNVTASEVRMIQVSKEWVSPELFQRYRDIDSKINGRGDLLDMVEVVGLTRALNYLEKQMKLHPKESLGKMCLEYNDYIRMSKDLHVDLSHKSVLFPADVVEAHHTITGRYNAAMNEIRMEKAKALDSSFNARVNAIYAEMGLSGFQKDGFCIVLPQKRTDLIVEGQSLNHCVGGDNYYEKCMNGRYMIFFVRKQEKPEKPYFTMEMDVITGKILQLYGFGDCSAPKEVRAFANAFAQFMHNKKARKTA